MHYNILKMGGRSTKFKLKCSIWPFQVNETANTMQEWKDILIVTELALILEILLTVPSQRETQPHLREEGEHALKTSLKHLPANPISIHVLI